MRLCSGRDARPSRDCVADELSWQRTRLDWQTAATGSVHGRQALNRTHALVRCDPIVLHEERTDYSGKYFRTQLKPDEAYPTPGYASSLIIIFIFAETSH